MADMSRVYKDIFGFSEAFVLPSTTSLIIIMRFFLNAAVKQFSNSNTSDDTQPCI